MSDDINISEQYIDFSNLGYISFTKPIWFSIFDYARYVSTWKGLYVSICEQLLKMYPDYFRKEALISELYNKPAWIHFSENEHLLSVPKNISDQYVIETNYDSNTIVSRIKRILDKCNVDYNDVAICYKRKTKNSTADTNRGELYLREDEKGFYKWMTEVNNLSESTVWSYFTYLHNVERYLGSRGLLSSSLYDMEADEFDEFISTLLENDDFLKTSTGKKHVIRSAVNKLSTYLHLYGSKTEEDDTSEWNSTPVIFPETDIPDEFFEGAKEEVIVNRYERDPKARKMCISYYGCRCMVCGIDFEEKYGDIGKDFIHVHHILPLNEIGQEHEVDFIKDLRPVCPNCHAILHRGPNGRCLSIDELREMIKE